MRARVRAVVWGWVSAYADRRAIEALANATAALAAAGTELVARHAEIERLNFTVARLDADLVKAQGTCERLRHDLRMADAEARRLTAELAARPSRPAAPGEDGYWKRKWLEDRRAVHLLQDRLLQAEDAQRPGPRMSTPQPIRFNRPALLKEETS